MGNCIINKHILYFAINSDDEEDSDEEAEEEEEDSDNEEKDSSKADSTLDSSKGDVDMSKLSKSARRRLKKKLAQQNKQPQVNGVDRSKVKLL